ncbi:hypothetical protein RI129_000930 [Pyrocoelia pectoralis]|uniref:Uncharacterized protein n=1 Tax=Pyrocoelia pectoralis TaxID=417401 RepID=A0AAN7VSH4_9COLE
MDSFCELPRNAPKPSTIGKIPIISSVPIVPEVSMIHQSKSQDRADSVYLSYKAWKEQNKIEIVNAAPVSDKVCSSNPQKKLLRFNKLSYGDAPEVTAHTLVTSEPTHFTHNKIMPFDQIYMANIPNKHLELSIVDQPRIGNMENINPNIQHIDSPTRHYLNIEKVVSDSKSSKPKQHQFSTEYEPWLSKCDTLDKLAQFRGVSESGVGEKNRVVDLYNQKYDDIGSNSPGFNKYINTHNVISTRDAAHKCHCKEDSFNQNNNDPTVKDLLKIIQQQNEQLIILQKQVTTLLNNQESQKLTQKLPAVNDNFSIFNDKYKTTTQMDTNVHDFLPKNPSLQQLSLDVMTSFEVSLRRPPNSNKMCNNIPQQPKICEITETECSSSNGNILDGIPKPSYDLSFSLNEPQLQVRESCPTPINSIKVDMRDYSSDSSDDDERANPAWTFYNNIMAQVNHILKKSDMQPTNPCGVELSSNDVMKNKMMQKVKQTTIKHLKSIGVHIPPTESVDEFNDHSMYNQNDVSFAVKQLLMKYLPNEQLSKVTHNQKNYQNVKQPGNIQRRPEFSIATVQYMQKYNLLNEKPEVAAPIRMYESRPNFDRILDVTAIKKQPKLL